MCITFLFYMCAENLALHQPAWQESSYRSNTGAERAVDGKYTNMHVYGGQCAVLKTWQQTAEWRVDLGGVKNIHHVCLHYPASKSIMVILSVKIKDCYLK